MVRVAQLMACRSCVAVALVLLAASVARSDEFTLEKVDGAPKGVAEAVAAQLDAAGVRVKGPQREKCSVWLLKSLSVPADFQSSAAVRYPFTPGQLVGVLSVPRRADFADFRGQEIEDGTYTLRYGRQPMDGNHIGTSDLADFLVVIPADDDESTEVISDPAKLNELSTGASGSAHPAILSLQPVEKGADEPQLTHDEGKEFWILQLNPAVKRGEEAGKLPVRIVVVGESEG